MTRGTKCKCSLIEVNGLINIRHNTLLVKSDPEMAGKFAETVGKVAEMVGEVAERHRSMKMTRGTECKCSSIEVNGLIYVRQNTSLVKSEPGTAGKVVERHGLIRMTREIECKCSSMEVNGLI